MRVDAVYCVRQTDVMTVRTIKRYSNRKLYDTTDSRYVTLQQIAGLIRNGDEIRVIDKTTQQDLTAATMAQIIFEEEKRGPRLPVEGLRRIIRSGLPAQNTNPTPG
jgi:polyhydroxyalkanoate synthesis repressor PhaR